MLALSEKQMLIQALGLVVVDEVKLAVAPIKERIAQFEKMLGDLPLGRDGADGKDGVDGKDADLDAVAELIRFAKAEGETFVREYVQGALRALPKAERGEKGDKGDKGDPGENGKDGRDGVDGADGRSVSLD